MPTLALIDGNSIAYRAFYALPDDLATKSGQVTNSVFGFTRMLIRLIKDHHPDGIAVAWDVGRKTFRTERYPQYKAQREKTPDHFRSQLPLIDEVLEALKITQLRLEGYEADDIIASLTTQATKDDWEVLIVTGDRDAFQLVGGSVRVLYTRRGISDTVLATAAWIEDRYGISPAQYLDYAALRGDSSDNLPGVPGVGEKTASRLIAEHGDIDGVYAAIGEMTPKLMDNLTTAREQVALNKELIRLVSDLDLSHMTSDFSTREWDKVEVEDLFDSLEFHSMWNDLEEALPSAAGAVESLDAAAQLTTDPDTIRALADRGKIVLGLVVEGAEPFGFSIAVAEAESVVVPFEHAGPLLTAIADGRLEVGGHDLKLVARAMLARGYDLASPWMDTALAAYILNPAHRTYELAALAERELGLEVESPDGEDTEAMLPFVAGPDLDLEGRKVEAVRRLTLKLGADLEARDESDLFATFELPLVPVLARMEHAGIGVDRHYLETLGEDLRERVAKLETHIHQLAGERFNVNSTEQLRRILFEKLALPVVKKTSTGKPSTDASVLGKLEHPLVERLAEYRELEKLRSTYVDGYLSLIDRDGRIRTRFNQMAATTGRLSSDSPNLQNIPVRSETGMTVRRAFVAGEGSRFLVADYSQIELRVLAHMCGDPFLIQTFADDLDVHTATAARVWDVPVGEVTSEQRNRSKMINFGLLYGMEAFGLADRLGISREEAKEHIDAYFAQFHKVREFMSSVVATARNEGHTTTLFGRRRYLPELTSDNFRIRQMGERMALNAPVQGTSADIIKKAMIELDQRLRDLGMDSALLVQIHDELILEVPDDETEEAESTVVEVMEQVVELDVPLKVVSAWGSDLADVKTELGHSPGMARSPHPAPLR